MVPLAASPVPNCVCKTPKTFQAATDELARRRSYLSPSPVTSLVLKLHLGTRLPAKLPFASPEAQPVRHERSEIRFVAGGQIGSG